MRATPSAAAPRLVLGIATVGRAAVLRETLREVRRQSLRPEPIIVCATRPVDVEGVADVAPEATILFAEPGLPRQRNRILDAADGGDIVLFIDDDFLMHDDYCAATLRAFVADPDLVVSTGTVLADGINGPGLPLDAARKILSEERGGDAAADEDAFGGYGCNMAVRMAAVRAHAVRVDERLPLYGWQEDVGFTRELARYGRVRRLGGARGVHLGTKAGRGSGRRLGYSQIANPVHLARVSGGGYPWSYALTRTSKNLAANLVRSVRPEPWVDRRGRLRGNLLALGDLLSGSLDPQKVLEL